MALDVDIRKTLRSAKQTFHLQARFSVHGPRIVVHGPSGAGKSLLLKAIAGLITPDEGSIALSGVTLFDNAAGTNLCPQERRVAYLFQDYALFPHLTVRQNVGFGLRRGWLNLHGDRPDPAIDSWLDSFELCRVAHQYPSQISGGQRQRTALARALVAHPRALLLDEPFAALDPALRSRMRAELHALHARLDVPMALITHDPEDVRVFGQEVLRLSDGVVEASCATEVLDPPGPYARPPIRLSQGPFTG
jgi:molybdate transport system ATP-binding protein